MDESAASGGWSIELWLSGAGDRAIQSELQRRVWDEFGWEALLQSADLRVEVADRVTVLDGTVDHYLAKLAAERAAKRVEGIRGVENRIRVQPPASITRSDADLAAAAARALEWSAVVPPKLITLEVAAGVVTLSGEVSRECQRAAAEDVVSRLAGVTDVRNQIAVHPTVHPERLGDRVKDVLRHEHARHVRAETRGDTVVLHGRVRSLAQRDELEHAVWAVPGVGAVRDEIEIAR